MSDPYRSPLTGRFLVPRVPLKPGTSLFEPARAQGWNQTAGVGYRKYHGYCSGQTPHLELHSHEEADLAYDDEGEGVWRIWIREETRSPPKRLTEEVAAKMALERDSDMPLSRIKGGALREIMEEARISLLHKVGPTVRIVPIIVTPQWIWIARRNAFSDHSLLGFLATLLGPLDPEPLLWPAKSPSWATFTLAALLGFVRSEGGELTPDLRITEIETKGSPVVIKTTENTEFARSLIEQMLDTNAQVDLKRLGLSVFIDGAWVNVSIDSQGAWRIVPRPTVGGLPSERLKRRFTDARTAAQRCGEVLSQVQIQIEEDAEE